MLDCMHHDNGALMGSKQSICYQKITAAMAELLFTLQKNRNTTKQ